MGAPPYLPASLDGRAECREIPARNAHPGGKYPLTSKQPKTVQAAQRKSPCNCPAGRKRGLEREIGSKEGDTFAEEAKSSIFVQLPKLNRQREGGYRREGREEGGFPYLSAGDGAMKDSQSLSPGPLNGTQIARIHKGTEAKGGEESASLRSLLRT